MFQKFANLDPRGVVKTSTRGNSITLSPTIPKPHHH
jgi:hypothetical protein